MSARTVEDGLREEYFALLPDIRRTLEILNAEVRCLLVPVIETLESGERVHIESRVKECESAIAALRRRQELRQFEESEHYSLTALKDLAGLRILAFPDDLLHRIDTRIRGRFPGWIVDPVRLTRCSADQLAQKCHGYCRATSRIRAEIQVVPMLVGLFWTVEHSALYKPKRPFRVERMEELNARHDEVIRALQAFEREFADDLPQPT
jgi:ppGpp synthetase/RelA/SpoT-type nucleotidyltranferase